MPAESHNPVMRHIGFEKDGEADIVTHIDFGPIVKPGPLEVAVVHSKTQWVNQMKSNLRSPAEPGDIAGIGWDLRLIEDDVKGWCFQNTVLGWIHYTHGRRKK